MHNKDPYEFAGPDQPALLLCCLLTESVDTVVCGLGGSVGCVSEWCSGGCGFDPCRVGNILS